MKQKKSQNHGLDGLKDYAEKKSVASEQSLQIRDSDNKQGWEIKKLGEVCIVERGSSPRPIEKYQTDSPNGVNWIKIGDTKGVDKYIYSTKEKITKEGAEKSRYVKEGDFILSNSMSFGKPFIMKTDGYIHDGWFVFRLPNYLDKDYFYYLLTSPSVQEQIQSLGAGAIVKNISGDLVKKVDVTYPKSLPEQQRIVSILDECFAAIAKALANAEQNLKNAKELFESYLQGVFEKKVHGEKYDSLNDLCELIIDCEHKTAPTQETGYPSIRTPNIGKGELILENVNRVSRDTYIKWTRRAIPKAGDLILAREAPAGNIAVVPENVEVCLGQRTVLIRPKNDKLIPKYLAYLILSRDVQKILLSHSTGATVQHINMKDIRAFKIYALSGLDEQKATIRQLDALRAEMQKLEAVYQKKIADLEELKKSILKKAFAGELTTAASSNLTVTKVIPLQKVDGISATDLQAGITSIALQKHIEQNQQHTFHHVKAEKIVHLAEYILNIDLERNPVKDAAGPNDFPHAKKVESRARKAGFYIVLKKGDYYDFQEGRNIQSVIQKAQNCLGEKVEKLAQLIDQLIPMNTQQAEIVATVYAAWNNLILAGNQFSDEDIVMEARENWREEKLKISREKFFNAIAWMRKNELLIPKGNGKIVGVK